MCLCFYKTKEVKFSIISIISNKTNIIIGLLRLEAPNTFTVQNCKSLNSYGTGLEVYYGHSLVKDKTKIPDLFPS